MPRSKFTDNNLKVLYKSILDHYENFKSRSLYNDVNINQIYDEMYRATQYTLESPHGSLYHLDANEKVKVYQSFNAIFYALLPLHQQQSFRPNRPAYVVNNNYHYPQYYQRDFNDNLLAWMMLSSMTHNCHYPSGVNVHGRDSTNSSSNSKKDSSEALAGLILVLLLAAAAAAAFVALYYMLSQLADSVERIWFNEGWLKAALMLATSVGFGAASSAFSLTVASPLLIALAAAAGFNPVGVVIVGSACLTVVGAGLATLVTSLIYDSAAKSANKDAMDPADPYRFRLTASDESRLINKGIDPVKVKCAIVALRAEIATVQNSEKDVPSYFSRHFFGSGKTQPLLDKVRDLRSGNINSVTVGGLTFDCEVPVYQPYQPVSEHSDVPPNPYQSYWTHVKQQLPQDYPSAPPMEYMDPVPPSYEEVQGQQYLYPSVNRY